MKVEMDAEGNEEEMAEEKEEEEEEWEGEDDEVEDYEMASRCLKSPHLSSFLTSDAKVENGSSSSSSALVYSPVPVMKKAAGQPELTSDDESASNGDDVESFFAKTFNAYEDGLRKYCVPTSFRERTLNDENKWENDYIRMHWKATLSDMRYEHPADYGMLTGVHDDKYFRPQFSVSEYPESYLTWIRWKGNRNLGDSSSDSEWFMSMERFIILLRTLFQDIQ